MKPYIWSQEDYKLMISKAETR